MLGIIKTIYDNFDDSINRMAGIKTDKRKELIEISTYSLGSFLFPFLLGHPQILLGALVNSSILMAALYAKGKKILPIIILPSIGALARGLLFGPMTKYLIYLLPFIWIGNFILLISVKILHLKMRWNFVNSAITGAVMKSLFLFASAYMLYSLEIIPKPFLIAMGIMQLVTASIATFTVAPVAEIRERLGR